MKIRISKLNIILSILIVTISFNTFIKLPTSFSKVSGLKAEGTFGWGGVHDEFPVESKDEKYTYLFKNDDEAYYRICQCGREPLTSHSSNCGFDDTNQKYEILWRKK